jgi:hypothetical protein
MRKVIAARRISRLIDNYLRTAMRVARRSNSPSSEKQPEEIGTARFDGTNLFRDVRVVRFPDIRTHVGMGTV